MCEEECCACAEEVESSAKSEWELRHFCVKGGINVNEMLISTACRNAQGQSIGENEKVEVCNINSEMGGTGTTEIDCIRACLDGEPIPDGGSGLLPPGGSADGSCGCSSD